VLKVLCAPEERNTVAKAVAQWDGLELEEAVIAAKAAGGMARTIKEWAQHHPQAAAITALPILEIAKIGEARSEPLPKVIAHLLGSVCSILHVYSQARPAHVRSPSMVTRPEDHGSTPAEIWLSGVGHGSREAVG
jgi:hypothetical protein